MRKGFKVRPFDCSLRDASGVLEVDQATFGDCPYSPETIVALEADPNQYLWVAQEGERVVGFVSAFQTHSLAASRWEVDELAVHPSAQRRGVGTALVLQALEERICHPALMKARALVSTNNVASQRVFIKNGFSPISKGDLLLYQVAGRVPRPRLVGMPVVRRADSGDAVAVADLAGCSTTRTAAILKGKGTRVLIGVRGSAVCGYAELVHVRTLQYEGIWVESLVVLDGDVRTARALFLRAIEDAKRCEEIDEVGYLVPRQEDVSYRAAIGEGFKKEKEYLVFERDLSRESACLR